MDVSEKTDMTEPGIRWEHRTVMDGHEAVVLCCGGSEAWVAASLGSNVVRWSVGGRAIIDFDEAMLRERCFSGNPILYPTPNRVRDGRFVYDGREFLQVKHGRVVLIHGLVFDEPWHCGEPVIGEGDIRLTTWIDFDERGPLYEAFPFAHRLEVEFRLSEEVLRTTYTIRNRSGRELPYGFALHPYFTKLDGDEGTFIALPAEHVMEATEELLPTGKLIATGGTDFDLSQPKPVGSLDIDNVFTGLSGRAGFEYRDSGLGVSLHASDEFTHVVLYTPPGQPYFCMENQTCSTDAHNMTARGFGEVAGLDSVAPDAERSGWVEYRTRAL